MRPRLRSESTGEVAIAPRPYLLDPDYLADLARRRHDEYVTAEPFPHAVIDDFFLDPDVLECVVSEFPPADDPRWRRHRDQRSMKLDLNDVTAMGPVTLDVLLQCNAYPVTRFLEQLTGIDGPSRGVKQAPFVVLMGVQMPASLIEIGFLTNAGDERALRAAPQRNAIADALARAVASFGKRFDARRGLRAGLSAGR